MLGVVGTMIASVGLLAAWKALPGLLIGRLLTGVSVGWLRAPQSRTSSSCASAQSRRATASPRRPAACGENSMAAAQAVHGQHSPVPKIPGIHRELPGPIHIVAIR